MHWLPLEQVLDDNNVPCRGRLRHKDTYPRPQRDHDVKTLKYVGLTDADIDNVGAQLRPCLARAATQMRSHTDPHDASDQLMLASTPQASPSDSVFQVLGSRGDQLVPWLCCGVHQYATV